MANNSDHEQLQLDYDILLARYETLEAECKLLSLDALTGIVGRGEFDKELAKSFARTARGHGQTGVLLLDVDHFKAVNDNHGHAAGDEVLRRIAQAANEQVRESDTFARYGGEEFVALIESSSRSGLIAFAQRIREAVASLSFRDTCWNDIGPITVSIGATLMDVEDSDCSESVKRADAAMYEAKASGRNRVHFFNEDI